PCYQRKGAHQSECEEGWNDQVEGYCWRDTSCLNRQRGQEQAIVVVVDNSAAKEWVVGWHRRVAQDGIEECELKRLLAAKDRLPEAWVEHSQRRHEAERAQEQQFDGQDGTPAGCEVVA